MSTMVEAEPHTVNAANFDFSGLANEVVQGVNHPRFHLRTVAREVVSSAVDGAEEMCRFAAHTVTLHYSPRYGERDHLELWGFH